MLGDLPYRSTEIELMDDPNISKAALQEAFFDINNCNKLLGGNKITLQAVTHLIKKHPKTKYIIVDMGCGDGSMLRELVRLCRRKNIPIGGIGIDLNEKAIEIAKEASVNYPEISYQIQDILVLDPKEFKCDILVSTLTMHHFSATEIPVFLKQFRRLAAIGVVINDLQRNQIACMLFKIFRSIFIKTKISKNDGLVSIQSGFTRSELEAFAKHLPKAEHFISWKWAFRYVWVIQPNRLSQVYE